MRGMTIEFIMNSLAGFPGLDELRRTIGACQGLGATVRLGGAPVAVNCGGAPIFVYFPDNDEVYDDYKQFLDDLLTALGGKAPSKEVPLARAPLGKVNKTNKGVEEHLFVGACYFRIRLLRASLYQRKVFTYEAVGKEGRIETCLFPCPSSYKSVLSDFNQKMLKPINPFGFFDDLTNLLRVLELAVVYKTYHVESDSIFAGDLWTRLKAWSFFDEKSWDQQFKTKEDKYKFVAKLKELLVAATLFSREESLMQYFEPSIFFLFNDVERRELKWSSLIYDREIEVYEQTLATMASKNGLNPKAEDFEPGQSMMQFEAVLAPVVDLPAQPVSKQAAPFNLARLLEQCKASAASAKPASLPLSPAPSTYAGEADLDPLPPFVEAPRTARVQASYAAVAAKLPAVFGGGRALESVKEETRMQVLTERGPVRILLRRP